MIGDDDPRPPSEALHATFSLWLHVVGRSDAAETPCPDGPRHCGQFAAIGTPPSRTVNATRAPRIVPLTAYPADDPTPRGQEERHGGRSTRRCEARASGSRRGSLPCPPG